MRVLKDSISYNQQSISVLLAGLIAFYALLYLYTEQPILSFIIFAGVTGLSIIGIGSIYLLLGSNGLGLGATSSVKLAFSELRRRRAGNYTFCAWIYQAHDYRSVSGAKAWWKRSSWS